MTSDALLALRQAIKSKTTFQYSNANGPCTSLLSATHIVVSPAVSLPKNGDTRLQKPGVTNPSGPQDFFTVEAVYLAWMLREASGAEYMKQARENGLAVGFISVTERKSVVDWLEGRLAHHERIVPPPDEAQESTTPPGSPPKSAASRALPSPQKSSSKSSSSPLKRSIAYVPNAADVEAVKKIKLNEIELVDRNTVLRGIKPNNFSALRQVFSDKLKKAKETSKSGAPPPSTAPTPDPKMLVRKQRHNYPIIIISSSPTALVTMHNVRLFLQEAKFEDSQEARGRAAAEGNPRPEDMIPIYRKRTTIDSSGKEIESHARYFVVDSTEALGKFGVDAWDRVVCVMTTGQAWQFKPYKWSEPRELFHHVKGFYVSWTTDPPNTKIKDWNVTELKIDKTRRHVDKSTVAHFWKMLDSWIMQHKPSLMTNPLSGSSR
ncbi:RNA polymerase II-associated protein [Pluteus cervinus]|uniref:RNA polymerase II-associated protein n=1 Tax=Pluteus cervinus TaxID=181527 RepID=A0ACD3AIQ9_9AGAR|nr:RNA polymerase II-associated protein [Pluteus cervinus]